MRSHLALFGLLTMAACTAAGSPARSVDDQSTIPPGAEAERSRSFRFPLAFPELSMELVDVHDFEDPMLGSRLTYVRRVPALRVDVFIFPMAPLWVDVPDSTRQRLVREMFEQGQEDIREYETRGRYSEVRFSEPMQLRLPSSMGPVEGWVLPIEMLFDGEPVRSQLYAFAMGNTFVKFRSTYPREVGAEIDPIVSRFVAAFLVDAGPERPGELAAT